MFNKENYRYPFEGTLPVVCKVLQQPVVATLTEDELRSVRGIETWGKSKGFLTFKQMQRLGWIWKHRVNNDEYVHWDWWPGSGTTHSLLEG